MADPKSHKVSMVNVAFSKVYADEAKNFRMDESYSECEPLKDFNPAKDKANLYEDIFANGLKVAPVLVRLADDDPRKALYSNLAGTPIDFLVLRGHRRWRVLKNIRKNNPDHFDKVECQVYSGLTRSDEVQLMADQAYTKALNAFEQYKAVKELRLSTNVSEEKMGSILGLSRGTVQRYGQIASFPKFVEENFQKRFQRDAEGNSIPHVAWTTVQLNELNKAATKDRAAGTSLDDERSEFMAEWAKVSGGVVAPQVKSLTRKEIMSRTDMIQDDVIRDTMKACAGDTISLLEIITRMEKLRERLAGLEKENADLKEQNAVLHSDIEVLLAERAASTPTPAETV